MDKPTIGPAEAMSQAGMTIGDYLTQATDQIDKRFGAGYARAHPELIAACVRAQADDFNTTAIHAVLHDIKDAIANL